MQLRVSAPGKTIVMGEHAAVYGRPALVAAVDRRVEARLIAVPESGAGKGLRLLLPQLEIDEQWSWRDLRVYAGERRAAWTAWFEASPSGGRRPFAEVLDDRPSQLVATAVGEALEDAGSLPDKGMELELRSGLPISSGFGSSAAAAAAVIQAVLLAMGQPVPRERVERLCLETERRQHGTPSGVDGAAVVRGGMLWVEPDVPGIGFTVEPVTVERESFFDRLQIAYSGPAAESTGEVVAAVRQKRLQDPSAFDSALERAAEATRGLRADLEAPAASEASMMERIRLFSVWLMNIGVVPEAVRSAIARIEAGGGVAKISGAGSLRGPGAGSFLVYHPRAEAASQLLGELEGIEPMSLRLGAPGITVEESP